MADPTKRLRGLQMLKAMERQAADDALTEALTDLTEMRFGETEPYYTREEIEDMVRTRLDDLEEAADDEA